MVCVSHIDQIFLHVPGAGGTALGAQPAMQAHVLVLDHDAAGLEAVADIEILRRGSSPAPSRRVRRSASSPFSVNVMQSIGQMSTQASHSMQSWPVNTVCTSQLRQRSASLSASSTSKPSSTSALMSRQRHHFLAVRHPIALVERDLVVVAPLVDAHLLAGEIAMSGAGRTFTSSPLAEADRSRSRPRGRAPPPR